MNDPYYAVAPKQLKTGASSFVEPGKAYRIAEFAQDGSEPNDRPYGRGFYIEIEDNRYYCLERHCAHLCDDNWTVGRPPYGPMCMNPAECVGKGSCPRDPTCGD